MGFEADWLAARAQYDEAALDSAAVAAIRAWGARLPARYVPIVVDLGSGTGAALERVRRWLAPRPIEAYAVDQDADLLARISRPEGGSRVVPIVGDLLLPLEGWGGPLDGTVDLVVGHALADLLPLDRLAARTMALLRPGGLAHFALAYDGLTAFSPLNDPDLDVDADLEAMAIAAFHQHMDRPAAQLPSYGGSTAGRRLGPVLAATGLEVVTDAPSIWTVRANDGFGGRMVLAGLLRFILEAVREVGDGPNDDLERWALARQVALARRTLTARVGHRDVLARAPGNGGAGAGCA